MPEISVVVYRALSEPRQGLQRLTREAPVCTQHRDTVTDFAAARESRRHVNRHRWGYIYGQLATTGGRRQPTPLGLHLQTDRQLPQVVAATIPQLQLQNVVVTKRSFAAAKYFNVTVSMNHNL